VLRDLRLALVDLVLPVDCAGCHAHLPAGGAACPSCLAALGWPARQHRPSPCPAGLPPLVVAAGYDGPVPGLVVGHKEHARLALSRPLGAALARAVHPIVAGDPAGCWLVPVPTSAAARRRRGHDPLLAISRRAASELRQGGMRAGVLPLLRHRRRVADQAGLHRAARAANLAGALVAVARPPPARPPRRLVLVDDVVTTGATLTEACRALQTADLPVTGAAAIAATPRHSPPLSSGM
jgi:predicted amidophosphoribosyltransferase